MKYKVNQSGINSEITRECFYLTVTDGHGNNYNIRVNKRGDLEVNTVGDDLRVVCKASNSLTVGIENEGRIDYG